MRESISSEILEVLLVQLWELEGLCVRLPRIELKALPSDSLAQRRVNACYRQRYGRLLLHTWGGKGHKQGVELLKQVVWKGSDGHLLEVFCRFL